MSSISTYVKSPANEKKLENYRNRVNSLSNIPRSPDGSVNGEKKRSVSESNASITRVVSAIHRSASPGPGSRSFDLTPSSTLSPEWDLAKLAHDSESLATSAAKEIRKSDPLKNGGLVAWIRKWSRKKQLVKVYAMFEALLPKLKTTEEEVMIWLTAVSEKKESTLLESSNMLKAMETSIHVYESYVDFYDELINDCLKISLDVSRELSDLRIAGAFNEELIPILAAEAARQNSCAQCCDTRTTDIKGDEQINISLETTPVKDPCSPEKEMEEKMKSPPSPPLSCPGSPTLSSKRFSPLPLPAANAGPAVWHGIKGSNMKRHMHVNFLIDVPIDYDTAASVPATTASSSSSSSTPSHMQENTPHPQRSPRSPPFSPVISPRSPSRLSLTNSSLQSSEDALNAINSLQLPESRYENEKSNKSDQKITKNYYDVRNIPFADSLSTHIASNNMSDIDSSGGVSLVNGDLGPFLGQGLGPGLGQGHGVRSSRIDDQLEARMEFAESSNSSNYNNNTNTNTNMSAENSFYDNRLSIISRLMAQEQEQGQLEGQGQGQGVVLSWAPNSGSGPNFGPFGGPNFGPYGGPNFGSKVTSDRWSALGTQFVPVTQGPLVPSASGVFNEIDSNILCDSCECGRADADDGNNIMVRGNTDYNSSDTAAAATASELFMKCYLETLSMGTDVYKDDVCTDIQVNKGTDESKSGCILRAAQSDIVSISQSVTDGGKVAAVDMSDISNLTVLNLIMNRDRDRDRDRDRQSSEEMKGTKVDDTECNHDVQKQAANSATVIKGKTYAEVVMSKKELIKEIEEERRRQEIEYTTSPRHSVNGKVLKESSPNATDVEVLKESSPIAADVEVLKESSPIATDVKVDAKNSLVGKELKLGNVFPAIDNTEGNNEIAATSSTVSSDNVDVQRNRLNSLDCSSVDSSDDDSTDDEEKGDRNGSTDADTLAARRKSLKSNSVSITKLKLTSPGKPLIKQNNTILNKLNSMVHTDSYNNGGNSGTVNTLFSVLSLGSSVNSNNSSPRNSPQNAVNDNKTFNNENTSFNNNYNSHSKTTNENIKNNLSVGSSAGLMNNNSNNNNNNNSHHNGYGNHTNGHHNGVNYQVNNTNYTVNNNNNNMKPNMNYNKSVTNYSNGSSSHSSHSSHLNQNGINGIQKNHSSSGSLQKLNHSHHSKNSVKRHGSLNSISNYGSNNFPNSQSPGKSKIKMNNISTHNNTNSNSSSSHVHHQSNNSMRDIASRHHSDSATYDQFEDDLLLHDDLYLQFTNKIQKFTELKDMIAALLKAMKHSRDSEQQHLRQVRRLWKELQAQKTDAIASVSKKIRGDGNDGTQPIHASILSKINLNNNQKAGLSFAPRHHSKSNAESSSRSPNRSRSSTQAVSCHVAECVGDLRVLFKEEMLAREKLQALKLLLDSTQDIGNQLQAFESICNNKSEHSSTPSSSSKKNSNNQKKTSNLTSQTNILNNLKVNSDYIEKDIVKSSGSGKINGQDGRLNSCSIDSSHSSFSNLTLPSTSS